MMAPQQRQWCLRRTTVNSARQRVQAVHVASSIHVGCSRSDVDGSPLSEGRRVQVPRKRLKGPLHRGLSPSTELGADSEGAEISVLLRSKFETTP